MDQNPYPHRPQDRCRSAGACRISSKTLESLNMLLLTELEEGNFGRHLGLRISATARGDPSLRVPATSLLRRAAPLQ